MIHPPQHNIDCNNKAYIASLTFLLNFWVIQFTSTWPCAFWLVNVCKEQSRMLWCLRSLTILISCVLSRFKKQVAYWYGYVVVIKSITSCMGIDYCRSHLRTGNWKVCCMYILYRISCVLELSNKNSKNKGLLATQYSKNRYSE